MFHVNRKVGVLFVEIVDGNILQVFYRSDKPAVDPRFLEGWMCKLDQDSVSHGPGNMQAKSPICTSDPRIVSIPPICHASSEAGFTHNRRKKVRANIPTFSGVTLQTNAAGGELCSGETFTGAWNSLDCSKVQRP
jgi:hypothetical protein